MNKPVSRKPLYHSLLLAAFFALSGCNSSDDSNTSDATASNPPCSLPCLAEAPVMDQTSISSAAGGTVNVGFTIAGDLANVSNISVVLMSTDFMSSDVAGVVGGMTPTTAQNTLAITVAADTPPGDYYPYFSFTALNPSNSGNMYYIDPTKSTTRYTFAEVVDGGSPTPALTAMTIPVLKVQ